MEECSLSYFRYDRTGARGLNADERSCFELEEKETQLDISQEF